MSGEVSIIGELMTSPLKLTGVSMLTRELGQLAAVFQLLESHLSLRRPRFCHPGPVPGWISGPAVPPSPHTQSDRPGPGHHLLLGGRLPPGQRGGGGDRR